MPLSRDPRKRAAQLANLRRGGTSNLIQGTSRTSWKPGDAPRLLHGAGTVHPERGPEWSPAVLVAVLDLEAIVGPELRDEDGDVREWARPSIEAVALARVTAWRADRWVADRAAKGTATLEDFERQSKVTARYHAALRDEALTLRSRLEATSQGIDLARAWQAEHEAEQRRREQDGGR